MKVSCSIQLSYGTIIEIGNSKSEVGNEVDDFVISSLTKF